MIIIKDKRILVSILVVLSVIMTSCSTDTGLIPSKNLKTVPDTPEMIKEAQELLKKNTEYEIKHIKTLDEVETEIDLDEKPALKDLTNKELRDLSRALVLEYSRSRGMMSFMSLVDEDRIINIDNIRKEFDNLMSVYSNYIDKVIKMNYSILNHIYSAKLSRILSINTKISELEDIDSVIDVVQEAYIDSKLIQKNNLKKKDIEDLVDKYKEEFNMTVSEKIEELLEESKDNYIGEFVIKILQEINLPTTIKLEK